MKSLDIELFDCFLEYPNKRAFLEIYFNIKVWI